MIAWGAVQLPLEKFGTIKKFGFGWMKNSCNQLQPMSSHPCVSPYKIYQVQAPLWPAPVSSLAGVLSFDFFARPVSRSVNNPRCPGFRLASDLEKQEWV